ncbi:alpha/beta hydrolase [Dokdonella soli]|uniref:Alpha/beta hydrolase n=1 Tax=Dokdonella soli TaxID=529810 RepID=A0ABN1IB46_9GAMM
MNRRNFIAASVCALTLTALAGCKQCSLAGVASASRESLDSGDYRALRRFTKTRFGDVAHVDVGIGPVALFLHGFPLNGFQWRGAIARLSPYRRCIAPDFLGLGHTRVAEGGNVAPAAQVEMLVSLLDALAIPSVDLVANDSGGAVAQLLVVRHPQRVRTLLLTNCDVETNSPPPALLPVIELARQGRFADEWLAPWRADKALARSSKGIGGMCYADPAQPTDDAIETYFAPLLASKRSRELLHAYAIALERNALTGIEAELRRSTVPTRIVWGAGDTIFSPASPDYLDHTFGASRGVRHLQGSKLFWPEERPDVIAEEARRLWNAWAPQAAGWR